jgi:hypothetical protein
MSQPAPQPSQPLPDWLRELFTPRPSQKPLFPPIPEQQPEKEKETG